MNCLWCGGRGSKGERKKERERTFDDMLFKRADDRRTPAVPSSSDFVDGKVDALNALFVKIRAPGRERKRERERERGGGGGGERKKERHAIRTNQCTVHSMCTLLKKKPRVGKTFANAFEELSSARRINN